MPIYYWIVSSDSYSKTLRSLCKYQRDGLVLMMMVLLMILPVTILVACFKKKQQVKEKTTCQTGGNGAKDVEIPLKYLSKFCITLSIQLINCEINLILP